MIDESAARAIVAFAQEKAHTKNLSGGNATDVCAPSTVQSATPQGVQPVAQFPSESGHWYDPATGNQVELPPRTRIATAIKKGYVPGVTTITKLAHKEAIQRWMVKRAALFTRDILLEVNDPLITDGVLIEQVWERLNADSDAITGRGKELHAAIEQYAHEDVDPKWDKHIRALIQVLDPLDIYLSEGNTEHSFATSRYGGKIDWHNDEWLLDFKTKPRIEDGKKLAYPEHAQQLAAYKEGLLVNAINSGNYDAKHLRCANVFIGVEDAKVVFHEWKEKDLLKGWRKFEALLNVWWSDYK